MQTTLLGLAIAIILAVLAALVGPLFIDWGGYRSIFETEASHLIGADVRVTGAIDARLLPSPRLTLNGVDIGKAADSGASAIHARSLGIEFALAPLMRGEWRATELHVAGPEVTLALDGQGHVQAPGISVAFDPDALTVERLSIEDGKLTFTDAANGDTFTLDKLWFNGEARSLLGPVKGEGAITLGGELYPFRLASGRYSDDGGIKLHVNVDPVNHPLSIESDGVLTFAGGEPHFDGTLSLTKPVGIASRATARLTQPWHLGAKLKVGAQSALMENVEYQYGSEQQGLKLTGVADFKFGKNPHIDGVLSGRSIDLDRVLVAADGTRPPPAAAMRDLIELGGGAFMPAIPVSLGIGIDQVTLGGGAIQNLRGDLSSDAGGWNLDRFEFRAPGFTQVRLSGHLEVSGDGVAFSGPAEVDANDPKALAAWLEGRSDAATAAGLKGDLRPLSLRGDVTFGSEKVAVDRLKAEFDRKTISGRLAYTFAASGNPSKLDAALNAPELDIDAALGFGKALLAGSSVERPHDVTIAAEIGRASVSGFVARDASARLKIDAAGLQIDKLAVADLGGAAFSASGRIVTTASSPRGAITVDLTAPDMAPVMAVLSRFAPATIEALNRGSVATQPAKLHARLNVDGAAPAVATLAIDGSLGKVRVALKAQGNADLAAFAAGDVRLDGKLEADDGKALVAMLGLGHIVDVDAGPGSLTLAASGAAGADLRLDGRLIAKGLDAKAGGTARPFADAPSTALRATVTRANVAPLRGPNGSGAAVPATFDGRIALGAAGVTVSDVNANVGGSNLRGRLSVSLGAPYRIAGDIEADSVDGAGLVAAAIGMPAAAPGKDGGWVWSSEPFAAGAFGDFTGSVALKVRRLDLTPQLTVREFRGGLRFGDREFSVADMAGDVAGGSLAGSIAYKNTDAGVTAQAKLSLAGSDAAMLLPAGARPPVTGSIALSAEVEGTGLSPVALIGSLHGNGKVAIVNATFAGLDPRAFDAVTRAVDQDVPIEPARIANIVRKAMESGQLSVRRGEGAFTIGAGQVRLANATIDSRDADLMLTGTIDLTDGSVDARLVLSGSSESSGVRPDIFMALRGPVLAPSRSIDVSALTGWLTLRAVENQAKRLRAIEAAQPKPVPPPPPVPEPSPPKLAPPPQPLPPAPKKDVAPPLPAPIDIRPAPAPNGAGRSAGSVGTQN